MQGVANATTAQSWPILCGLLYRVDPFKATVGRANQRLPVVGKPEVAPRKRGVEQAVTCGEVAHFGSGAAGLLYLIGRLRLNVYKANKERHWKPPFGLAG